MTLPLRLIFDTNVLLSLFVFADSRFLPLRAKVACGAWIAHSNATCLAEFKRVLGYPAFALDSARQQAVYAEWLALHTSADALPVGSALLPRCTDRDDQKFLELARDAGAHYLITADKALLKLARRDKLAHLFRIITPQAALLLLDSPDRRTTTTDN